MDRLTRHLQSMNRRVVVSGGIYGVFCLLAVLFGVAGTTMQEHNLIVLFVPLIGAFMVLPRETLPRPWPRVEDGEAADRLEMLRNDLMHVRTRATYMRFFYLGIAFLLIYVLPKLGI